MAAEYGFHLNWELLFDGRNKSKFLKNELPAVNKLLPALNTTWSHGLPAIKEMWRLAVIMLNFRSK
jgi:hypothetical protein